MKTRILGLAAVTLALALPLNVKAQGGAPPFAGGKSITTAEALKQAPKDDPSLVPMDRALAAAAAALKKSPKDAKVKKAYVETAFKYGKTCEDNVDNKLSKKVQYRAALKLFNLALAVDPKHKPSLDKKQEIENIYKTMGGIPK